MHTWNWQTYEGRAYLTCSLLDSWPHGFFTREFWPQLPAALAPLIQTQTQTFRVQQVHGNQVLSTAEVQTYWQQLPCQPSHPDEAPDNTVDTKPKYPQADGLFSQAKNQGVWVCTADVHLS